VTKLGDFLLWEVFRKSRNFLATFLATLKKCINFDKNGLGDISGHFFTSSSGHPACQAM
jgi:hypothetical protein